MILIVGAGLTGLSAAWHLKNKGYIICEKEATPGGLCRTMEKEGFLFDFTGHLLHFRRDHIKGLVFKFLKDNLIRHERRSYIYSNGVYTEYPFQYNTYGLPKEVVFECVMGFLESYIREQSAVDRSHPHLMETGRVRKGRQSEEVSFEEWIYKNFGAGIAKHFMIPFNEKLWCRPLSAMTADWVSWLIPRPSLKDVIKGAIGYGGDKPGYNASFYYPVRDGISVLPGSFLPHIQNLKLNTELLEIHTKKRKAILSNGDTIHYEYLVSTIPLPELIMRCVDIPRRIREDAGKLTYVSIYNISMGIEREKISDKHWVYFPEKGFPFYRVGFQSNLSPNMAPQGFSSCYIEVSHRPDIKVPEKKLLDEVTKGMERCAILKRGEKIAVKGVGDIQYGYVIYNRHRMKVVPNILESLEKKGIYSTGRYGAWEHSSMEDAMEEGRVAALKIMQDLG